MPAGWLDLPRELREIIYFKAWKSQMREVLEELPRELRENIPFNWHRCTLCNGTLSSGYASREFVAHVEWRWIRGSYQWLNPGLDGNNGYARICKRCHKAELDILRKEHTRVNLKKAIALNKHLWER